MTGYRECGWVNAMRDALDNDIVAGRKTTSGRGTITSRNRVVSAWKTSTIIRRSTLVNDSCASTSDRSSSWPITSPRAFGLPPSSLTNRSEECPSSHTTGVNSLASTESGRAPASAMDSLRCRPSRLGVSSPSTSEQNEMINVTPTSATGSATVGSIPISTSHAPTFSETVAAPNADDNIVATVTPICTAARNWVGLETSFSSSCPLRPLVAASCSHLALPQRDHRDFGRVEDTADHDENQDHDDVPQQLSHEGVPLAVAHS